MFPTLWRRFRKVATCTALVVFSGPPKSTTTVSAQIPFIGAGFDIPTDAGFLPGSGFECYVIDVSNPQTLAAGTYNVNDFAVNIANGNDAGGSMTPMLFTSIPPSTTTEFTGLWQGDEIAAPQPNGEQTYTTLTTTTAASQFTLPAPARVHAGVKLVSTFSVRRNFVASSAATASRCGALGSLPAFSTSTSIAASLTDLEFAFEINVQQVRSASNGDPHILRWNHTRRNDFHGECDLVLIDSPTITIHTRNTMRRNTYSFIEQVAVRIGRTHYLEMDSKHFWINRVLMMPKDATEFPFQVLPHAKETNTSRTTEGEGDDPIVTIDKLGRKKYKIEWGTGSFIIVRAKGVFMNVEIDGTAADFATSVGIMGEYGTGRMLDRQGNPMKEDDFVAFGMEWQVKVNEDPELFSTHREPQWPDKCRMPTDTIITQQQRRNLRADSVLAQRAEKACEGAIDFEACVMDVVITGEIGLAETFF